MDRPLLRLALLALSPLSCAAGDGTEVATRDAGSPPRDTGAARDTGVRRDAPAAVDRPPVAMDAPPAAMDVPPVALDRPAAMDVPPVAVDRPAPIDLGAPVDLGRDAGSITLGDAWSPERDAGDPTPRDVDRVLGGAPSDSASRFGGAADPARAPSIVYPEDGTVLPPNLTGFEVHFRPGAGNDLFEVSLRGDRGALRVFTRCTVVADGCVLSLDEPAYAELARVAQPSGDVVLTVRATSAVGGGVGRSATRSLGVTNFDVRGGLYYWAASSGSINRYEFGRAGARTEPFLRGDPINCVGCHVLSRDGSRIMAGRFIPAPSATRIFDVTTRAPLSPDYGANFGTFSPDVRWLLTSDGNRLALRDPSNGNEVPGLAPGTAGSHPDWSRGGRSAVFSRPRTSFPIFGTPGHNGPADLFTIPWGGASFGAATTLVRADGTRNNNYYPSYSPDDAWVLFNRAAGNSNHNLDAQLWVVPAAGGSATHLARADLADSMGNSWPKWAPFVQRFHGEPLMWFTFSSRRDYGLRLRQQTREAPMRTTQLWMAAFRPGRVATAEASTPAFWLPFQSLSEGNHIAQWAEQVQRQGCTSDRDCVQAERCLPISTGAVAVYRCVVP
nr:hypothetical protein [Deltaproteobacteria bacterium]